MYEFSIVSKWNEDLSTTFGNDVDLNSRHLVSERYPPKQLLCPLPVVWTSDLSFS